jgi:uncharacterized membrane protein
MVDTRHDANHHICDRVQDHSGISITTSTLNNGDVMTTGERVSIFAFIGMTVTAFVFLAFLVIASRKIAATKDDAARIDALEKISERMERKNGVTWWLVPSVGGTSFRDALDNAIKQGEENGR